MTRTPGSISKGAPVTQPAQSPPEQLLPPRLRRAAVIVIAICVVIFAGIGALVAHDSMPTGLDSAVWNALPFPWGPAGQHGAGAKMLNVMDIIRQLGGPLPTTFLTVLLCYCCLAMRRYRAAILVAGSEIVASGLTEFVFKPLVGRTLGGSLSYPSGHATAAFALAVPVVLLLANAPGTRMPRSMRVVLSVTALGMASLVGFGMVAWHQHYLTDTFGGAAVGIGVTLGVALVIDFVANRRGREAPRAPVTEAEPAQLS
jgi:membrane-associated phospholipid phosphatase